jgi:hypothetical protein
LPGEQDVIEIPPIPNIESLRDYVCREFKIAFESELKIPKEKIL